MMINSLFHSNTCYISMVIFQEVDIFSFIFLMFWDTNICTTQWWNFRKYPPILNVLYCISFYIMSFSTPFYTFLYQGKLKQCKFLLCFTGTKLHSLCLLLHGMYSRPTSSVCGQPNFCHIGLTTNCNIC